MQQARARRARPITTSSPATWPTPSAPTTGAVLKECCALEFEETAPGEDGPHTYLSIKFPLLDDGGEPTACA